MGAGAAWDEIEKMASKGTRKLRPIRPSKRDLRDAVRGLATEETTETVETTEATTRDARYSAQGGLEALAGSAPSGHGRTRPFEHPIYWACAIVFGA